MTDHAPAHLTIAEIAERLKISRQSATRKFQDEPGVIDLGTAENVHRKKRRYRELRVPLFVYERVLDRISNKRVS